MKSPVYSAFRAVVEEAKELSRKIAFSYEDRVRLSEKYQKFLESLEPELRELEFVVMTKKGVKVIKRSEIPKLLIEDEEVFQVLVETWSRYDELKKLSSQR